MISFCIIGKNEENVLDKCLKALVPYGYEIIFVDTGSTDRTRDIALRYTEKVFDFHWVNDFSAARNFSICKAENEFILPIDCDEIVTEFDKERTEQLIRENPDAIGRLLRVNEFSRDGGAFDANEFVSRLFSKKLYRYQGSIHEQVVRIDGTKSSFYSFPLKMLHFGYDGDTDERNKKTERNRILLLEELEQAPQDTYILYQIGKTFYMEQDYVHAAEYFERAISLDMNPKLEYVQSCVQAYGYTLIELKRYEDALGLAGVYDEFSGTADFVFLMGLIYMHNGLLNEAVNEFTKATTMEQVIVWGTNSYRAYYNIGVIYECVGEIKKAKNYYLLAGEFAPAKERVKLI